MAHTFFLLKGRLKAQLRRSQNQVSGFGCAEAALSDGLKPYRQTASPKRPWPTR
ncbi:hypothetical protein [Neisseria bacilliformis]|uniref:hypothetical protein n=1 Tax=Neisseria bacilliformis TaxID=267212 RepID=UPI001364DB52|nr:hypothetical protein [Neisseria bacilliformis]